MPPSIEARVQLLGAYFRGRPDVYALQNADGSYGSIRRPLTREVLLKHARGDHTVALYLLLPNSKVTLGVLDIDTKGEEVKTWVNKLFEISGNLGLQPALEPSGKKGYHLWYLFKCEVEAALVRHLLVRLTSMASATSGVTIRPEVFPKQTGGVELGNHIKLPLGIHREVGKRTTFIDPATWQTQVDWGLAAVGAIPLVNEQGLKEVLAKIAAPTGARPPEGKRAPAKHRGLLLCYPKMERGVSEGGRDQVMFRLAVHYWDQGYTPDQALEKLNVVNAKNSPPLDRKVIQQKVEQAYKERYGFGCNEPAIAQFCDSNCPIYRRRNRPGFGVDLKDWQGEEEQTEAPDQRPHSIRIIDSDPPYFEVSIWDTVLTLDHEQMKSLAKFKTQVFIKTQRIPQIAMRQVGWELYVNEMTSGADRVHAPEITTQWAQNIGTLYEWLRETPASDSYETIKEGRPLLDNGRWYFRGQDAIFQLRVRYHLATVPEDLWSRYIRLVGGNTVKRQTEQGEELDLWWVPRNPKLLGVEEPTLDLEN